MWLAKFVVNEEERRTTSSSARNSQENVLVGKVGYNNPAAKNVRIRGASRMLLTRKDYNQYFSKERPTIEEMESRAIFGIRKQFELSKSILESFFKSRYEEISLLDTDSTSAGEDDLRDDFLGDEINQLKKPPKMPHVRNLAELPGLVVDNDPDLVVDKVVDNAYSSSDSTEEPLDSNPFLENILNTDWNSLAENVNLEMGNQGEFVQANNRNRQTTLNFLPKIVSSLSNQISLEKQTIEELEKRKINLAKQVREEFCKKNGIVVGSLNNVPPDNNIVSDDSESIASFLPCIDEQEKILEKTLKPVYPDLKKFRQIELKQQYLVSLKSMLQTTDDLKDLIFETGVSDENLPRILSLFDQLQDSSTNQILQNRASNLLLSRFKFLIKPLKEVLIARLQGELRDLHMRKRILKWPVGMDRVLEQMDDEAEEDDESNDNSPQCNPVAAVDKVTNVVDKDNDELITLTNIEQSRRTKFIRNLWYLLRVEGNERRITESDSKSTQSNTSYVIDLLLESLAATWDYHFGRKESVLARLDRPEFAFDVFTKLMILHVEKILSWLDPERELVGYLATTNVHDDSHETDDTTVTSIATSTSRLAKILQTVLRELIEQMSNRLIMQFIRANYPLFISDKTLFSNLIRHLGGFVNSVREIFSPLTAQQLSQLKESSKENQYIPQQLHYLSHIMNPTYLMKSLIGNTIVRDLNENVAVVAEHGLEKKYLLDYWIDIDKIFFEEKISGLVSELLNLCQRQQIGGDDEINGMIQNKESLQEQFADLNDSLKHLLATIIERYKPLLPKSSSRKRYVQEVIDEGLRAIIQLIKDDWNNNVTLDVFTGFTLESAIAIENTTDSTILPDTLFSTNYKLSYTKMNYREASSILKMLTLHLIPLVQEYFGDDQSIIISGDQHMEGSYSNDSNCITSLPALEQLRVLMFDHISDQFFAKDLKEVVRNSHNSQMMDQSAFNDDGSTTPEQLLNYAIPKFFAMFRTSLSKDDLQTLESICGRLFLENVLPEYIEASASSQASSQGGGGNAACNANAESILIRYFPGMNIYPELISRT